MTDDLEDQLAMHLDRYESERDAKPMSDRLWTGRVYEDVVPGMPPPEKDAPMPTATPATKQTDGERTAAAVTSRFCRRHAWIADLAVPLIVGVDFSCNACIAIAMNDTEGRRDETEFLRAAAEAALR